MTETNTSMSCSLEDMIDSWSDREVLENLKKFFPRARMQADFIQQDDGMITHQVLSFHCGDLVFVSKPKELDWPLQPANTPQTIVLQ